MKFTKLIQLPVGLRSTAAAIAASRAGAVGVVNAECEANSIRIITELDLVNQHATGAFGVFVDRIDSTLLKALHRLATGKLAWLIVDPRSVSPEEWSPLQDLGVQVLLRVLDDSTPAGLERADGLVVKGHESGGYVGEDSCFVLLQKWLPKCKLPLYAQGGITPNSAAACHAAGVQGVVLDSQLLLLNEVRLTQDTAKLIGSLSGSETIAAGDPETGNYFRILLRPDNRIARNFVQQAEGRDHLGLAELLAEGSIGEASITPAPQGGGHGGLLGDWGGASHSILPLGQDVCFAKSWKQRYGNIAGVCRAIDETILTNVQLAVKRRAITEGAPLATKWNTRYPIVQGPMTRVSDSATFAASIAEAGGLPMIAFALLRGARLEQLLEETKRLLGGRPWGVGLLGFAPQELLDEQLKIALKYAPNYAIIAGGRPDQVVGLEASGIESFLHVPSANLIPLFVDEGARKFILEGRECGGHVGPLSSFVLWSTMVDRLTTELDNGRAGLRAEDLQVLFAGGIHDALSAAMLQALAAPLSERGVNIGVLMGSAYLFTKEIVDSGAVVEEFQAQAIACERTVNLESGPGHASRCAYTPFARDFFKTKRELSKNGAAGESSRQALDDLILGRLRIASKGQCRSQEGNELLLVSAEQQAADGMYMLGQVATLRHSQTSIAELHREVSEGSQNLLSLAALASATDDAKGGLASPLLPPADIAIIGLASVLPHADSVKEYWENILDQVDAIVEIPRHRWDARLYFDENRKAKDKIYSKWGGFLNDVLFDPAKYGMPPRSVPSVDPMQLIALEVAARTLRDAGYEDRPFNRERASVIVGASGGTGDVGSQYGLRAELPRFLGSLPDDVADSLPEWTEDSFAGILNNVIAGRIANRLNFGGANFTTDAACASSLAAVYQGVSELCAKRSDLVIAGGVDTVQGPFGYLCFSQTQALSPRGICSTFDSSADGIVISEGVAMVALKRLEDAERDGDRIYAVIKGMGASSDGKARGMTAPLPAGQVRAMRRAYAQAGYGADTVGLFEAHGTGTVAGDTAELESTTTFVRESGGRRHQAAIGSVKTMIGHTKATAGVAGLIKTVLALHHQVLPPHRGVDRPNAVLNKADCPLFLPTEAQSWLKPEDKPRRASVSAFGFGGTNFHLTLEEYSGEFRPWLTPPPRRRWTSELLLYSGADRKQLATLLLKSATELRQEKWGDLASYAARLAEGFDSRHLTVAILAKPGISFVEKLEQAAQALKEPEAPIPSDVFLPPLEGKSPGKLAILFSGQGSQYPGMLRELALCFKEVSDTLSEADRLLKPAFESRFGEGRTLSSFIYPRASYAEGATNPEHALRGTDVAQPALGAVDTALFRLITSLGVKADMFAGHSFGEFVALHAAGAYSFDSLMRLSAARGRLIVDEVQATDSEGGSSSRCGTMAAIAAPRPLVEQRLRSYPEVTLANHNGPEQCVVSGPVTPIQALLAELSKEGLHGTELSVSAAFHSPLVAHAKDALKEEIGSTEWHPTILPVYSNESAQPHGSVEETKSKLAEHLVRPVEFVKEIEAMYEDGARIFLEIGPQSVLSKLTTKILNGKEHQSIALDQEKNLSGFLRAIARLAALGVPLDPAPLFAKRTDSQGDLPAAPNATPPSHAWWVNGSGARRVDEAPRQIGLTLEQAHERAASDAHKIETSSSKPRATLSPPKNAEKKRATPMSDQDSALKGYFETMQMFLQTQERVMSQYLGERQQPARPFAASGRRTIQSAVLSPPEATAAMPPLAPYPVSPPAYTIDQRTSSHVSSPAQSFARTSPTTSLASTPAESKPTPPESKTTNALESRAGSTAFLDLKELTSLLLDVVEEKTGYPKDMVGTSQNLEGELGIDSIKRIEVIGALLQRLPQRHRESLNEQRGQLNTQPTLDGMLKILTTRSPNGEGLRPFDLAEAGTNVVTGRLPRYCLQPKQELADKGAPRELCEGLFILTDDGAGVAERLAERLRALGRTVSILNRELIRNEDTLVKWVKEQLATNTKVGGIVHLAPLGAALRSAPAIAPNGIEDLDAGAPENEHCLSLWRAELQQNEKSLFLLIREFDGVLTETAHIVATSALGGLYGRGAAAVPQELTLAGGAVGLLKSYSEERPERRVKAIDLDGRLDSETLVSLVLDELQLCVGRQEVGYPEGKRTIFHTVPTELISENTVAPLKGLVLATGGARGVTAEVLRDLAATGVIFALTGRRPLPGAEPPSVAALGTASDLKNYFIDEARSGRAPRTPKQIENEVQAVLSARETLANLADFRSRGALVEYHAVDVVDARALKSMIDDLVTRHGPIVGVVHGAGVIEDRLVAQKSSDSWTRVVETKVIGLLNLQRFVSEERLRFFSVFSSVAGRYGNSGQADYATANELMNRLCCQLKVRYRGKVRVNAFCWGPWGPTTFGAGMVTRETEAKFKEKGVELVSASVGREMFRREVLGSHQSEVEVVCGDGPWERREDALGRRNRSSGGLKDLSGPLLGVTSSSTDKKGIQTVSFRLGEAHEYLTDHRIDGVQVLPAAAALELMAEAVASCWPGWKVVEARDICLLSGIKVAELGRNLEVILTSPAYGSSEGFDVACVLASPGEDGQLGHPHYRAVVRLEQGFPVAPAAPQPPFATHQLESSDCYSKHLFHGPRFQVFKGQLSLAQTGAHGIVAGTSPQEWLTANPGSRWTFDPGVVDAAPQMSIIVSRLFNSTTTLPTKFGRVVRYVEQLPPHMTMLYERLTPEDSSRDLANISYLDEQGNIVLRIEELECIASTDLNRLGSQNSSPWMAAEGAP